MVGVAVATGRSIFRNAPRALRRDRGLVIWLIALATVAGAAIGRVASRWLGHRSYRYDDERDIPTKGHGWVAAACALVLPLMVLTGVEIGGRTEVRPDAGRVVLAAVLAAVGLTLVVLAAIDLDVQRLPDRFTGPLVVASVLGLLVTSLVRGEHTDLVRSLLAGVGLAAVYGILVLAGGASGLGLGDAKLAPTLGLLLGYLGWVQVVLATVLGFVSAAVVGLVLVLLRRADRHSSVAFGPHMIGAAVIVIALPGVARFLG